MRLSFQHPRQFASELGVYSQRFTSSPVSLIAASAQHFFYQKHPSSYFETPRRLVKVIGENQAQKISKIQPKRPNQSRFSGQIDTGRRQQSYPHPSCRPQAAFGGMR